MRQKLHRGTVDAEHDREHAAGDARQNRARADDDALHDAQDTIFDAGIFHIAAFFMPCARRRSGGTQRGLIALFAVDKVVHRAARGVVFEVFAEELHIALAGVAKRHVARHVRREQEVLAFLSG